MSSKRLKKFSQSSNYDWSDLYDYQESLFRILLGDSFNLKAAFKSILRIDAKPSAALYWDDSILKYRDFTDTHAMNIVEFFIKYSEVINNEKLNFTSALVKLRMLAANASRIAPKQEAKSIIDFYVMAKGIVSGTFAFASSKTLADYKIQQIEKLSYGNSVTSPDNAFLYSSPDGGAKLYYPDLTNDTGKWKLLSPTFYYDGEWLLPLNKKIDFLYITTSRKDSAVLYEHQRIAINPFTNEMEIVDVEDLRIKYNIGRIIYVKDLDDVGDTIGEAYIRLGCTVVTCAPYKDPYDALIAEGKDYLANLIKVWENEKSL